MNPTALRSNNGYLQALREVWQAKVHFIFLSQFLFSLGACVLIPHIPTALTNYFAGRHSVGAIRCTGLEPGTEPPEECKRAHDDILARNALTSFVCSAVLGTLLTPLLCRWSDYYGRKPFLIYGTLIGFPCIFIFVAHFLFDFPLWWFYPAEILRGSFAAPLLTFAYISDVIDPNHRTTVFGIALTPFGTSLILGPMPTTLGWLTSPMVATLIAAAFLFASLMVILFFVPESLPQETRQAAFKSSVNRVGPKLRCRIGGAAKDFWMSLQILFRTKYFFKLAVCLIILSMLFEEVMDVEFQYLQEVAGFGTKDQALLMSLAGVGTLFVQSIGLWALVSVMGMSNKTLVILGLAMYFLKMVLLAFCSTKLMAFLAVVAGAPVSVVLPSIAAIKASYVSKEEQGAVQGALGGAQSFAKGIGPIVFWGVFYVFRQGKMYLPGAPFFVCAVLTLCAIAVAATVKLPAKLPAVASKLEGIEFVERRVGGSKEFEPFLAAEKSGHPPNNDYIQPL
ncbi:hypothetical protein BSKO_02247 [Bryopsis sp. KO-2023]|nr:hypothetical protein BSKO_02247 [Bryopsis sp. KO-2023]